jgi:hypothetical protein
MKTLNIGEQPKTMVNKFPYQEVFPQVAASLITELQSNSGFPPEFSSLGLLFACAVAIGNSVAIRRINTHIEAPVLYGMLIAPPNSCKTHPITFMFKPLEKLGNSYYVEYRKAKEKREIYENLSKEEQKETDPPPKAIPKSLILSDLTLEGLLVALQNNPRGIIVKSDEILGFIRNINKYNRGSDIESFNSAWSLQPISVHRKGTEPLHIDMPFICIIGGIQTKMIETLFTDEYSSNGFLDRFLFVMPGDLNVTKWSDSNVNTVFKDAYDNIIDRLFSLPLLTNTNSNITPVTLDFTKEAKDHLLEWRNNTHYAEVSKNNGETIATAWGKMDIYVLRFALILQLLYWAAEEESKTEVGLRAVQGAIRLTDYFKGEVAKVHRLVHEKDIRLMMSPLQRAVFDQLPLEFKREEAVRIAAKHKMTIDVLKKFLKKEQYFNRTNYGMYRKQLKNEDDNINELNPLKNI